MWENHIVYVTSLVSEVNSEQIYIEYPKWPEIKKAIFALDGWDINAIILGKEYEYKEGQGDTKEFMSIAGGGENGLYVCDVYYYEGDYGNCDYEGDNGELVLFDTDKSYEDQIEIVRVFPTNFSAAQCLKIEPVLVAAETYDRFGRRDESLHWGYVNLDDPKFEIVEVKYYSNAE